MKNKREVKRSNYVGGSGEPVLDEREKRIVRETIRERRIKAAVVVCAIAIFAIAGGIYATVSAGSGRKKSRELIKTYMEGMKAQDAESMASVADPDADTSDMVEAYETIFEAYRTSGITYGVVYEIGDGYAADDEDLDAVCNTRYGKTADEMGIDKGYVFPVTGTINLIYEGNTSPSDLDVEFICYEKDDEWYLGGTISDSDSSATATDSAE